jgi:transcriptional regulator GlxA family with amidase domain
MEDPAEPIGFLLLPGFSMMSFAAALEPLRVANRVRQRDLYRWHIFSLDGGPVVASNGIPVGPHSAIGEADGISAVFVCAGIAPQEQLDRRAIAWLRRLASRGALLGSVSNGGYLLAEAGLLDGYRCTVHWENMQAFADRYPRLQVTGRLFEIDRDRVTCAGGTAALDMMLHRIATDHGHGLSAAVAEQMVHTGIRDADKPQRMDLRHRLGVSHPRLLRAIRLMEQTLAEPLSTAELAREVGVSPRQLERLFKLYLGCTPSRYYLEARLKHGQALLWQTAMPIIEVAQACGFASASHFARSYRAFFGRPPRAERHPAGAAAQDRVAAR